MSCTLQKQADQLTARYLNDVNDATAGGAVVSLPSGVTGPPVSATQPGDRIVLDDITALALSDTAIGTLFGGVYMYVGTTAAATAAAVLGALAFWPIANIGVSYVATTDALPTAAIPTYIAGVLINVITKGNFGWIQTGGVATVLFDTALTATAAGNWVSAKVSPTTASSADCGAVVGVVTLSALLGTALGLPATSTASKVMLWRGFSMGRI